MDHLIHEFEKLIHEKIELNKTNISSGMCELVEYKRLAGHISGLREALDLIQEAKDKVMKS